MDNLIFKNTVVGRRNKTTISVAYIKDIANNDSVLKIINYYQKIEDSKNAYTHLINEKQSKKYDCDAVKDNLNAVFGNNMNYKEKIRRKVNYKDTEVNQIFEKGKNNIPVGYKELTPTPGKVDFNQLSNFAKNNFDNLRKNGRKPLKKDF